VTQEFAHTRLYADIDFTFYVDMQYDSIKFFEGWMDYISGSGVPQTTQKGYFRKMAYPDSYKVSQMKITKFERDIKSRLEYTFINAFPKGMTISPISYGPADLLKVTVSFNYDRYLMKYVDAQLIDALEAEEKWKMQQTPNYDGPGSFIFKVDPETGKRVVTGVRP
jgi:hypothetical protein